MASVAVTFLFELVTGQTSNRELFTLYVLPVGFCAWWLGVAPALTVMLSALLLGELGRPPVDWTIRVLFLAESSAVVFAAVLIDRQLAARDARVQQERQADLRRQHEELRALEITMTRQLEASKAEAERAQRALLQTVAEARDRLSALERLTDPGLSPIGGTATIAELVDCLRATIDADGIAVVRYDSPERCVFSTAGLHPDVRERYSPDSRRVRERDVRVTLIHNDPARIGQVSAVRWPPSVTSLMIVPVVSQGTVSAAIEVVNERPKSATDWDVTLIRTVADRLSQLSSVKSDVSSPRSEGPGQTASGPPTRTVANSSLKSENSNLKARHN